MFDVPYNTRMPLTRRRKEDAPDPGHFTRGEATVYASRLRNDAKKAYAFGWIRHRFDGAPRPLHGPLSAMAAQAVRSTIGYREGDSH